MMISSTFLSLHCIHDYFHPNIYPKLMKKFKNWAISNKLGKICICMFYRRKIYSENKCTVV